MKNLVESFYTWYRATIRNNKYRWLIVLGTLAYLLSPFDISPDVFPIIGWIDDGILATLLVTELSQIMAEFLNKRIKREAEASDATTTGDQVIDVQAQ
jgi:uncharacterized membrane protein YkvA (DUF1232 family)